MDSETDRQFQQPMICPMRNASTGFRSGRTRTLNRYWVMLVVVVVVVVVVAVVAVLVVVAVAMVAVVVC